MWTIADRRPMEDTAVGRFSVEFEVANNDDMVKARAGLIKPTDVRRATIEGLVDPGATRLVLPRSLIKQLGLPIAERVRVQYADRRVGVRDTVRDVWLKLQGRSAIFDAIIEPKRKTALIGAIVLETLDFLVDPVAEKLLPRDPKFIVAEIE
jgi:predicted aspartyl protease